MAKSHGKNLYFSVETQAGAPTDLSAYTMEVTGLPSERELGDVTCGGATGHAWLPGLQNAQFQARMVFDDGAGGSWAVLKDYLTDTTTRGIIFGQRGNTGTYPKISCEAWVKSIETPAKATDPNIMTVNFQLDGGVTIGTF